jgi:hypothetical protein
MESMARQDVLAGQGFALLDPHGDLVEKLVAWYPEELKENLSAGSTLGRFRLRSHHNGSANSPSLLPESCLPDATGGLEH